MLQKDTVISSIYKFYFHVVNMAVEEPFMQGLLLFPPQGVLGQLKVFMNIYQQEILILLDEILL